MDKSSRLDIPLAEQVRAWEQWNASTGRGTEKLAPWSRRQSEVVMQRVRSLGRSDLTIIDVGCGNGWMCERLSELGSVTGTDLVDDALEDTRRRCPQIKFVSGDIFMVGLPLRYYDVVVCLEVLSHVADQPALVRRLASLLKPGGHLVVATQNRPVLERWSCIPGPTPGQIRRWVDARQLRQLLAAEFIGIQIDSVCPVGDQGVLRFVNSVKLNKVAGLLLPERVIDRMKEGAMLGHTLMAWAVVKH